MSNSVVAEHRPNVGLDEEPKNLHSLLWSLVDESMSPRFWTSILIPSLPSLIKQAPVETSGHSLVIVYLLGNVPRENDHVLNVNVGMCALPIARPPPPFAIL